MAELDGLFPEESVNTAFLNFQIVRWSQEPFIGGGISFPSLNGVGQKEILAKPINNTLFFAGEATNTNGHEGTIHGAMESSYRAVKEILES